MKSTSSFPDQTQTSLSFSLCHYYRALGYFALFDLPKRLEQIRIKKMPGLVLDIWFLSQMASKCGKNKNVAQEAQPSVTDDHILKSSAISSSTDAWQRVILLFHIR